MRETYQNILNAILVIFLFAAAILFFKQQKTINQLSSSLKNQNNIASTGKANTTQIEKDQKKVEASVKSIAGRLISISGNDLKVEADLPDWQKMKEARDASKPALTYKKTYSVTTNSDTKFSTNKLDSLKAGDTIVVASKELVYQTDKLTAVFIASPSALPGA